MAYPGHDRSFDDLVAQAKATAKSLTVAELKNVLRHESLQVSGIKSELQIRIIAQIEKAQHDRNRATLDRIRARLTPGRPGLSSYGNSYPSPYSNHTPAASLSPQYAPTPSRLPPSTNGYNMAPQRNPFAPQRVNFADSPFYNIRYTLSGPVECKARETTRDTARINLTIQQSVLNELQDENARIMVFCAVDDRPREIAFPHQVELKVNENEVKTNLRGLKNKPGSTRPADITKMIRKKAPGLNNTIEMTYALTNKDKSAAQKFYLVINMVKKKPVDTLVQEVQRGKSISRDQVLREMQRQAADPEIVATSSIMSLKCPLSYMRISTPCRGVGCKHNQCFDAASYLQLQEQAPTWTCPVCSKTTAWEHLVLDLYMLDILKSTSKDTEEVTIEPDGRWHLGKGAETPVTNGNRNTNPTPSDDGDSDDALEIIENPTTQSVKREYLSMALTPNSVRTPPLHSRDESRATSHTPASGSRSNKRPAADVIDLTLSDDDDDQPIVKRQRPSISSSTNPFYTRPPDQARTGTPSIGNGFSFAMPPPNLPSFDFDSRFGSSY